MNEFLDKIKPRNRESISKLNYNMDDIVNSEKMYASNKVEKLVEQPESSNCLAKLKRNIFYNNNLFPKEKEYMNYDEKTIDLLKQLYFKGLNGAA